MVGFFGFGGGGFGGGFGFGNVGWIPLAPFEIFRPWYGPGWWRGGRFGVVNNVNVNLYSNFRNARVAGGVNAVSAADFQRGAFSNHVAVGARELQQASMIRGAVPVSPTASNLRFSGRTTAFNPGSNGRSDPASQRFFSRMSPGGSAAMQQRTPFAQQQAATRAAFSGAGQGFGGQAGAHQGGGSAGSADSGWSRFGEPSSSGGSVGQRSSAGTGNWDRFGVPQSASQQRGAEQGAPRAYGFNSSQGAAGGYGQSRSLQVAPPIVRQRESAPSGGYRGGGGSGPRGGGGGSHSGGGGHGQR
jgi:hypothetical protein